MNTPAAIHRSLRPATRLLCLLSAAWALFPASPAGADTPAAAVERLVESLRTNDLSAYREALADDFFYNGARREHLNPFSAFGMLAREQYSHTVELQRIGPDVATARVDLTVLGFFDLQPLGVGIPAAAGVRRVWMELRRQPEGDWRVSALRTVHRRLLTAGWPAGQDSRLTGVGINGQPSTRLRPGEAFTLAGGSNGGDLLIAAVGDTAFQVLLQQKENEPWSVELRAPDQPGRYFAVAVLVAQRAVPGGFPISWDEVTVPLIVE